MKDGVSFVWGLGALVLVGSSLLARRLPLGQTVRIVLVWVAIFGGVFVLFLVRDEGREVWRRASEEVSGRATQSIRGDVVRIRRDDDGHFWVDARVVGQHVRFLIDSGATVTTLTPEVAKSAGVEPEGAFPIMVQTANGLVQARRGRVTKLSVGTIVMSDVPVQIGTAAMGSTNLLGMSFLSELQSWRVEGQYLFLVP